MNANENALRIFNQIAHGRESERTAASALLDDESQAVDRPLLRKTILEALLVDYVPGREVTEDNDSIMWTRSWLVNTLGKICKGDELAEAAVRRHIDHAYEPGFWVRYWAMESLIKTEARDLLRLAEKALADPEPAIHMLAVAVIATRGSGQEKKDALAEIEHALGVKMRPRTKHGGGVEVEEVEEFPPLRWAALRALRIVPIPQMFDLIRAIIAQGINSDGTYDAIIALGAAPPNTPQAAAAVGTLTDFLKRFRSHQWMDTMRSAALWALGRLKDETAATVILEAMSDDNPAVAREAALALKEVVDIRTAAARVVEVASKSTPERAEALARALRWMERDQVVNELESVMVSGRPEHQEAARLLMSEIGGLAAMQKLRARTNSVEKYGAQMKEAEENIRALFEKTIKEARKGFEIAVLMDVAVFVVGLGLVITSAVLAFQRDGDLSKWAGVGLITGGAGVAGVLHGLFFAHPRQKIEEAVDHLMHLKVVFLAYLRQLHQVDQAFTRRILEDKPFDSNEAGRYSRMVENTMCSAVDSLPAIRRLRLGTPQPQDGQDSAHPPAAAAGNGKPAKPEDAAAVQTSRG